MNGIINVIKPPGMTSSGAVVYLRRILGEKRIGHTGTLDPGAAGVLPVCVGRSTKLSQLIMDHEKSYLAEILFGVSTDTLDSYGAVSYTHLRSIGACNGQRRAAGSRYRQSVQRRADSYI